MVILGSVKIYTLDLHYSFLLLTESSNNKVWMAPLTQRMNNQDLPNVNLTTAEKAARAPHNKPRPTAMLSMTKISYLSTPPCEIFIQDSLNWYFGGHFNYTG